MQRSRSEKAALFVFVLLRRLECGMRSTTRTSLLPPQEHRASSLPRREAGKGDDAFVAGRINRRHADKMVIDDKPFQDMRSRRRFVHFDNVSPIGLIRLAEIYPVSGGACNR